MRLPLLTFLMLWAVPAAQGMYAQSDVEKVPIARLLGNLEQKAAATPDDYDLRYQMARLHAMASIPGREMANVIKDNQGSKRTEQVQFAEPGSDNGTPETWQQRTTKAGAGGKFEAKQLEEAIRQYEAAMSLMRKSPDRSHALWLIKPVQLGHAWCLDKAGRRKEAIEAYRQTLAIAWQQEITRDFNPEGWFKGAKYDAGTFKEPAGPKPGIPFRGHLGPGICFSEETIRYLLAILDPHQDAAEIGALNERKKFLSAMPRAVTPILIPLGDAPIENLTEPRAEVVFDLDGSGLGRRWGWITPRAAWLVFDGRQTGRITSGLQLFGNVTFWVFWRDGYQALSSLDANGDGALEGEELRGLALWQDANGDGVSEPDEVKPLSAYGIDRISCRGEALKDGLRWNPAGVHFKDGTTRASSDWDVPMNAAEASK